MPQKIKIKAKKTLGQHFLNSRIVLGQIISAANVKRGELILEIGPGTGVLTTALLESGAKVLAIEKDREICELLKEKFFREINTKQLELIPGDILSDKITSDDKSESIEQSFKIIDSKYAVVANIPYYITGAILEKFLENKPRPTRMILLVQKEVADRIVARDKKESVLSISVKAFGTPKIIKNVPKGAFTPPPNVDSAILSIADISDKIFVDNHMEIKKFFAVVKSGFAHKRKYAIRNLEIIADRKKLEAHWLRLNLDPKSRPEDISLEKWLEIAKCV
jgi:16S rRNA (adenine1518-N6/adenine1519-N6)-dimethyltransferase